ncbi:MAG: DUF3168 domain-containing protein [Prevotellaceae bacterium]|nr:DUF3168 domain-containing protein [Prevotellaceae bacterium]
MAANKSILSAGEILRNVLASDEGVSAVTSKIFPVVVEDAAVLPYIAYSRQGLDSQAVKTGRPADTAQIEVACYAASYAGSVDLAEAVRDALEGLQTEPDGNGFRIRSCHLTDATENIGDGCYVQYLTFTVRI